MALQTDSVPGTSHGLDLPPKVTLVFDGDDSLDEEPAFLMEVSSFFETLFRSDLYDGSRSTIDLKKFNGAAVRLILETLRRGKNAGMTIRDSVVQIMSSEIFQDLKMLLIKADLEELTMFCKFESIDQIHAFKTLAEHLENKALKMCWLRKVCGIFPEYRKTKHFKNLSFDDLKLVLENQYLDYPNETQILRGVLGWINKDIERKEKHFIRALALINWTKVFPNQIKFLLSKSKIVKKSDKLKRTIAKFSLSKKLILSINAENNANGMRVREKYSIVPVGRKKNSIALIIQIDFFYLDVHYVGAFLYDYASLQIKDVVYASKEDITFEMEFDIYDFKWYLFGRNVKGDALLPHPCQVKTRQMLGSAEWTTIGGFGPVYRHHVQGKTKEELAEMPVSKAYRVERPSGSRNSGLNMNSREVPNSGIKTAEELANDEDESNQDAPINVQRSGRHFYVFSVGCDVFDTGKNSSEVLWPKDGCDSSHVKFPFIYSACRSPQMKVIAFNIENKQVTSNTWQREPGITFWPRRRVRQPRRVNHVPRIDYCNFITTAIPSFFLAEKYKTNLIEMEFIKEYNEITMTQPKIMVDNPILHLFDHEDCIYIVQSFDELGKNRYKLKQIVSASTKNINSTTTDLGDLDLLIKEKLSSHFNDSDGKTLKIKSHKKFKLVNSAWVV
ncbi:uncharacterized protein LOC135946790 [Cloeon dipterum]|uniref:uncharacterized protein LOC135946790 n=1 Tax=Cloeon dipterum TaxID=197152 RepID=UPI0032209E0F